MKLPAAMAVGQSPALKEPRLDCGRLFWLEQRPAESGRTTLMLRSRPETAAIELTPGQWNLRSRVHDYGGGAYAVAGGQVVFVHDGDRCLWSLKLVPEERDPGWSEPRRLTAPGDRAFADGLIDSRRGRWIGVMEAEGRDHFVAVPLSGGEPQLLRRPADFCGYAALSPGGDHLAWVEWEQPFMPWQASRLWLGRIDADGALVDTRVVAGGVSRDTDGVERACSVFQPLWLPNGDLVAANDRSGWWNLERLRGADPALPWETLLPMPAEFAMPQWVYGMRTSAWDGRHVVAAACVQGQWQLGRIELPKEGTAGRWQPIDCPFDDLAALSAENGRLVAIASAPDTPQGLLDMDLASGRWSHHPVVGETAREDPLSRLVEPAVISRPEALWFAGHGGRPTHAWYYPPRGGSSPAAPLLVKGHGGPNAMARTGLNLAIQYWTSRGWGVVDVNYGGSTGFGRAYRERLDGQWGVVDVADCAAAARAVVAAGRASPDRIAIEGGSAGGFTVLAALCFTDVFNAGACRYPVTDLAALACHPSRFEARYLDGLVGPWPQARSLYDERSPLHHADRIRCPVIFFHGLEDKVVPPEQTERMALALSERGIPVAIHLFPGEDHGFRSSSVQVQVLDATEAFFRRHFNL